jgi:hypothetical protein
MEEKRDFVNNGGRKLLDNTRKEKKIRNLASMILQNVLVGF